MSPRSGTAGARLQVDDPRWAALAFAVAVFVAAPVAFYLNRDQWFFLDEWDYLATRGLGHPGDLLRPHNEHWSTIPIVLYRVIYRLVGLHHYWPYQVPVFAAHVSAAVLLRAVMRRAQVTPWVATTAATVFLFFGTGRDNIAWGFQVAFVGSLAFGLGHLLLADHDGPFERRDVLGIGCGIAALMCSGVGVAMAVVVGVAVLLGRGWKPAVAHVAPLAAVYLVWFATYGREGASALSSSPGEILQFGRNTAVEIFDSLGQNAVVGLALAALLLAGWILLLLDGVSAARLRPYAATIGLVAGALAFIVVSGYSRAHVSPHPAGRYIYLGAAMMLPAITVAMCRLAELWRPLPAIGVALLLFGLPANVRALEPRGFDRFTLGAPGQVLVMAATPSPPGAPRSMRPLPLAAPGVTLGWLRDADSAGKIPDPRPGSLALRPNSVVAMSVEQVTNDGGTGCAEQPARRPVRLRRGDLLRVGSGTVVVTEPSIRGTVAYYAASVDPVAVDASGDPEVRLRAVTGPLTLALGGTDPGAKVLLCRSSR